MDFSMPRPSRNIDQLLIQAGLTLLPKVGMRGLSIRQIAEHAGVNLGMFHYHFKTKGAFVRVILDQTYNELFESLTMVSHASDSALENLRASFNVLAKFGRDHRELIVTLMGDGLAGEQVAVEFLHANMPRHLSIIMRLLEGAQREGTLKKIPLPQALTFMIGAVAAPIMGGAAAMRNGLLPPTLGAQLETHVFTDRAILERIDMALMGLAASPKTRSR